MKPRGLGLPSSGSKGHSSDRRSLRLMARFLALGAAGALAVALMPATAIAKPPQPNLVLPPLNTDWPQFRHDATHQGNNFLDFGVSPSTVGALGVAWTGATGGSVGSSPAVANGVVYVGSTDHKLYAYAVGCASGGGSCTPLWTATTGDVIHSSPAVANGVVYVGSYDHNLYAYAVGCRSDGGTCAPLWTGATGNAIDSSPTVANDVVYVGSTDHKLYAFPAGCRSDGGACTPRWIDTTGGPIDSSPAVANGMVYVGSDKLYAFYVGCISVPGCTPLWTATTGGLVRSSPAVANGVVYVGSDDRKLYAFDAAGVTGCSGFLVNCTPLWTATTGYNIGSSPAVADGVVYVGSDKLYAYAVGCASGGGTCSPLWTGDWGEWTDSSPAVDDDVVYVGSSGNSELNAYAVGCNSGGGTCSRLWTATTGGATSSPAVANGAVYVGSADGKLYAFKLNPLDHLVLSPANAEMGAGESLAYTAQGFDVHGNSLGDLTGSTTFTISGGGSCTGASCTSTVVGDHTVTGTDGSVTGAATLHVVGATYHALSPTRLLDTRNGTGGLSGPFTNHVARTFQVTGGSSGVPAYAKAVTGNLTVTGQTSNGYLYIGPVATNNPTSSTLNFPVGDDRANAVTVALGGTGTLSITFVAPSNGPTAQAIFDVTGYFTPDTSGATYHALSPNRVLDTRSGTGGLSGPFTNHVARTFQVTGGSSGVPTGAKAVTGNLTVTGQTSNGYLYIGPIATNNPTSSTLNFPLGDDRANAVTVQLGAGGTLAITFVAPSNGPTAQAIFDVTGYFTADMTGAVYVPITPTRGLDTRNGTGGLSGPFTNHAARTFQVTGGNGRVPTGAKAVTGNLTVTGQTSNGYLFIGPIATNNPTSSTLNFPVGDDRANAVTVALGGTGTLSITFVAPSNGPTAQGIFDVTGYFVPPGGP